MDIERIDVGGANDGSSVAEGRRPTVSDRSTVSGGAAAGSNV